MAIRNTQEKFGSLTKLLHWLIFLLFVTEFFLVYRREYFPKGAPEKLQYILLHKSIGVCLLLLALLMITWRHVGQRPLLNMPRREIVLAKLTHFLLYISMLLQPLTGICMSLYSGKGLSVFGLLSFPTVTPNPTWATFGHTLHVCSAYVIMGLVSLHVSAALYHHFIRRDHILKRMLPF